MEEVISLELPGGCLLRITSRDRHENVSAGGLLDDLHIYKHLCLPSLHIKSQLMCACFLDFVMFWSCILMKLWHIVHLKCTGTVQRTALITYLIGACNSFNTQMMPLVSNARKCIGH